MQDLLLEAFLDIFFLHCVSCELLLSASTSPGQSMSMKHYNLVMLFHFFDHCLCRHWHNIVTASVTFPEIEQLWPSIMHLWCLTYYWVQANNRMHWMGFLKGTWNKVEIMLRLISAYSFRQKYLHTGLLSVLCISLVLLFWEQLFDSTQYWLMKVSRNWMLCCHALKTAMWWPHKTGLPVHLPYRHFSVASCPNLHCLSFRFVKSVTAFWKRAFILLLFLSEPVCLLFTSLCHFSVCRGFLLISI